MTQEAFKSHVATVDEAIEVVGRYASSGSINYKNHLNSQGKYSTVDPVDIAEMQSSLHAVYLFLCNFSHQIANEKTFEMTQYDKVFKIVAEAVKYEREECAKIAKNRALVYASDEEKVAYYTACKSITEGIMGRGKA